MCQFKSEEDANYRHFVQEIYIKLGEEILMRHAQRQDLWIQTDYQIPSE